MSDNIFTRIRQQHAAHEQQHPSNEGSAALAAPALGLSAGLTAPGLYPRLNPSGPFQAGKKKQEEEQPEGLIAESVGIGGVNKAADMEAVARHIMNGQIIKFDPFAFFRDRKGYLGKVITAYQKGIGFKNPDGRIDPDGTTERNLLSGRKVESASFAEKRKKDLEKQPEFELGSGEDIAPVISEGQFFSQLKGDSAVPLPWLKGQMGSHKSENGYRYVACFQTCRYMLLQAGFNPEGKSTSRYMVEMASSGKRGSSQFHKEIEGLHAQAVEGKSRMDRLLEQGKPVIVGVNRNSQKHNARWTNTKTDGKVSPTDHFVVIVGRQKLKGGKMAYRYFDPGRSRRSDGANPSNLLIMENGYITGEGYKSVYTLSEVRNTKES